MKRNILKDWERSGWKRYVRKSLRTNYACAVVLGIRLHPSEWRYYLKSPNEVDDAIPATDIVASHEEVQRIVDVALEEAGWEPITDKLKILLEK